MCKGECNISEPERSKGGFDWLLTVAWVVLLTFSIGTWALLIVIVSVIFGA